MPSASQNCALAMLEAIPVAMQTIRQQMRRHRLPGMSVPQLRVLAFLDRRGSGTLSDVAEHVGTTLPSMSRMIQSLVQAQFVQRRAGASDRRTICLEITAKGRGLLKTARQATQIQLAAQINTLTPAEIRQLQQAMSLLQKLFATGDRPHASPEKRSPC